MYKNILKTDVEIDMPDYFVVEQVLTRMAFKTDNSDIDTNISQKVQKEYRYNAQVLAKIYGY